MNLMIDGMPGCGKTTAITNALRTYDLLPYCCGFRTVRVLSESGQKWGYAQFPASEDIGISVISDEELAHMIFDFRKKSPLNSDTFTGFTVSSLKQSPKEPKLILMDEIGGGEIGIPQIRNAYLNALKGPLPCIGVIKSEEHAKAFDYENYRRFRDLVEKETDTEFLYMNAENRQDIFNRILCWLLRIS